MVVPAFAGNFDTLVKIEDKSASMSSYASYGTVYDSLSGSSETFSYTVPDGGAAILIFYIAGTDNDYSSALFKDLTQASWAKSSKLNIIAIEWGKATQSTVKTYMSKYDTNGVVDKSYYNSSANYIITWYYNYVKNGGDMSSISPDSISPCYVVLVGSDNGKKYIRYATQAVKSASQISSALSTFMDTSSLVSGYSGYLNSGSTALGKLPKTEIAKLLSDNPQKKPSSDSGYFDVAPSVSGTYKTGTVKAAYLQAATNRLSALRKIAGLPGVTMDTALNSQAQYGAVLLAASNFDHYPDRPSDMDKSFFDSGTAATSTSNISAGRHLTETPDGFMKDEGTNNLPYMGHRRWQLNPYMAKVGFGFAINYSNPNSYGKYTDEMAHDNSGEGFDYKFISWPASGNFPRQIFDNDTAWSVTLSPAYYETPNINNIKVTLTRSSDGKKWTFSKSESYSVTDTGKYFTVDTQNMGISNCIIFRPAASDISKYDGEYTVVISGLKDSFGNTVSLSYKVQFFDADSYTAKAGWTKDNGYWYYYDSSLNLAVGWKKISGKWYYFNKSGQMLTGWQKISKKWYYFNSSGVMQTGWLKLSGKWYYFESSGAMLTGWQKISKKWYYFNSSGVMLTGWQKISKKWYYFNSSGVMQTGWLKLSGKWYYFESSGVMLANCSKKIGNKTYKFDKNGVCLNP